MSNRRVRDWLGSADRDPGCEASFEVFDQYVDALLRGDDVRARFPEMLTHLANCPACREDAEGLLAALRDPPPADESR